MNGPSTSINDIVNENNKLSNEESEMVDYIISDLNSSGSPPTSQERMPQITDEEREVIMRQKAIQEQERRHYQMQQQQKEIQQEQLKQQEQMINMYSQMNKKGESLEEKIKDYFVNSLDVLVVFILSIVFNVSSFSEFLKFKSVPFLYNIETDSSTHASIVLKGLLIAIIFAIIKHIIK